MGEVEGAELGLEDALPVHVEPDGEALAELRCVDLGDELVGHHGVPSLHTGEDDMLMVPV